MILVMLFLQLFASPPLSSTPVDSVEYMVDSCIVLGSLVFSPNEDEKNDLLVVPCIEANTGVQLSVFNRWGQEVYQSDSYANDWTGTNQGSPLSNGVYPFKLILTDNTEQTGYITIIR